MSTERRSRIPTKIALPRLLVVVRVVGLLSLGLLFLGTAELPPRTLEVLGSMSWPAFGVGLSLYVTSLLAGALRTQLVVRISGHALPLPALFFDLVKSTGLNAMITTGTGEVYRVARLRQRGVALSVATGIVVVDRGVGLLAVVCAGLVGAAVHGAAWTGVELGAPALLLLALGGGGCVYVAGIRAAARWAPRYAPLLSDLGFLAAMAASSLAILLLWIASVAAFAWALGLALDPGVVAFAVPLVTLATLLPISIGGIGVREAGYALLLAPHGVATSEAVALGVVQYLAFLAVAGLAWLLLLSERGDGSAGATLDASVRGAGGR